MSTKGISWFGQVQIYVGKCFRMFVHEKQWKNFLSAAVITGIISIVTSPDVFSNYAETKNGLFAVICGCVWTGLFNSIQSICRERAIIKREHRTGLSLSSYITAHAIYEAFLCAVESLIILLLVIAKNSGNYSNIRGLIGPAFLDMYITIFLVVFCSDTMAILVSSIVRKENTAMTIMPFVLIVQLVMSGAVFPLTGAAGTISVITVSKWGMDGLLRISNSYNPLWIQNQNIYYGIGYAADPDRFPLMEPARSDLLVAWGVLIASAIVYLVLSTLVLRLVDKDKRI